MEYHGRVVSLLMTANERETGDDGPDAIPHVIGRPLNGLSVVSVSGTRHAILLVSDLESSELSQLSRAIAVPLARRLDVSLGPGHGSFASLQFERPLNSLALNAVDFGSARVGLRE
jgi:hypothetical protein